LAEKRTYEVVFIVDTDTGEEETARLIEGLQRVVTDLGGTVSKNENMGRRALAYKIGRKTEGHYVLFEIEGTGREIAELERRMRVNDAILRYLTVRVDEDRQRAEKLKERRVRKAGKRPFAGAAAGRGGAAAAPARERAAEEEEA
jgi:small subunit ribosomal protein S6